MRPGGIPQISPRDAAAATDPAMAGDEALRPLIVDVREVNEFASERIEGSVLIPLSQFADRHAELPKDRPLVMQCHTGSRSSSATMFLLRHSEDGACACGGKWTDVRNLDGGIAAWMRDGLPVRTGPPDPGEGDL
jgi:rhodanese-related sulfurtransferase